MKPQCVEEALHWVHTHEDEEREGEEDWEEDKQKDRISRPTQG